MCYYAPFGSKEMWDWHTTVTIKKQQTLAKVLYREPKHCIRAVKTATSYTDRTKLLPTVAVMSTYSWIPRESDANIVHLRRRNCLVPSCSRKLRHAPHFAEDPTGRAHPRSNKVGPCNVNKGVTNGILDTSTAWNKIF